MIERARELVERNLQQQPIATYIWKEHTTIQLNYTLQSILSTLVCSRDFTTQPYHQLCIYIYYYVKLYTEVHHYALRQNRIIFDQKKIDTVRNKLYYVFLISGLSLANEYYENYLVFIPTIQNFVSTMITFHYFSVK